MKREIYLTRRLGKSEYDTKTQSPEGHKEKLLFNAKDAKSAKKNIKNFYLTLRLGKSEYDTKSQRLEGHKEEFYLTLRYLMEKRCPRIKRIILIRQIRNLEREIYSTRRLGKSD